MAQAANSALFSARLRFVEGLGARAEELSNAAERLSRNPGDLEAAGTLRRRLHALLASAQVFEERALSLAVQDLIARLDVAQRAERPFTSEEIDAVSVVVASLPTYVRPSLQPPAAHSDVRELLSEPRTRASVPAPATLTGVDVPPARDSARSGVHDAAGQTEIRAIEASVQRAIAEALAGDMDPRPDETSVDRGTPRRGRRIIALAALQPGSADRDEVDEPHAEAAPDVVIDTSQPLIATAEPALAERAGVGPLPMPEVTAEPPPFALSVEPEAGTDDAVTQTFPVLGNDEVAAESWSHAVEDAGETLVAWRESLRPAMPEIEIEPEAAVGPIAADPEPEVASDDAITLDVRPDEPITLDARPEPEALVASAPAPDRAESKPELPEPNLAESGVYASGLSARAAAILNPPAAAAFAEPEPDSSVLPTLPLVAALLPAPPQTEQPVADANVELDVDVDDGEPTSPGLGPPVLLEQTVSGLLPAPEPSRVLLVGDAACTARVSQAFSAPGYALVAVASADEAVRQLHEAEPHIVLVSAEYASAPETDLVRRLKLDPLAPVARVYVLLSEGASCDDEFLRQIDADGAVSEPLTAALLAPLVEAPDMSPAHDEPRVREGTIDDIANQIAEEIRRGIAESLKAGKNERVSVGDGTELMAAAWSAIGRVRSHLAEQNRGRVSFKDADRAPLSLLPPTSVAPGAGVHPSQLLAGYRVLVADDDPAVLWFFVGLLREASAQVLQAHNGREALELARRKQPHVIVSDILMPKLDGFGLCRELKRDALLSRVPVILLSWKDDLLQRMRELDAGAAGYLRKEAGSQQILAQLTDVLAPRARLQAKLRGNAEVTGSLEEVGALGLLELVAAERPDARITLRDAYNLFEVDIRGGRKLSVTRTAADGAFTRGEKALMQLLGLADGQFEVTYNATQQRATITEPLDRALVTAGRRLAALLDAVSDARLLRVCLIAFDDDVLASLLSSPSARLSEVVELFRTGNATAESMLRDGLFAPGELEDYLRELARSVAINGVWDSSGEDLVLAAQRERETPQLGLLGSSVPPRPSSSPLSEALYRTPSMRPASLHPPLFSPRPIQPEPEREPEREPEPALVSSELTPSTRPTSLHPPPMPLLDLPPEISAAAEQPPRPPADTVPELAPPSAAIQDHAPTEPGVGPKQPSEQPLAWAAANPEAQLDRASVYPGLDDPESDAISTAELQSFDLPTPSMYARAQADRTDTVRFGATLIVLIAVGYFGWQQFSRTRPTPTTEAATSQQAAEVPAIAREETQDRASDEPAIRNTQFGKVLPFVDASRGVEVPPDQGLLVVEFQGDEPAPSIRVGTRELGKPPLALALPAGRHELVVRSGKSTSFRYLIVRAGETRIVSLPLAEL